MFYRPFAAERNNRTEKGKSRLLDDPIEPLSMPAATDARPGAKLGRGGPPGGDEDVDRRRLGVCVCCLGFLIPSALILIGESYE